MMVRAAAVNNPGCPTPALTAATEDPEQYVRSAVLDNPACPPALIDRYAASSDTESRGAARSPSALPAPDAATSQRGHRSAPLGSVEPVVPARRAAGMGTQRGRPAAPHSGREPQLSAQRAGEVELRPRSQHPHRSGRRVADPRRPALRARLTASVNVCCTLTRCCSLLGMVRSAVHLPRTNPNRRQRSPRRTELNRPGILGGSVYWFPTVCWSGCRAA